MCWRRRCHTPSPASGACRAPPRAASAARTQPPVVSVPRPTQLSTTLPSHCKEAMRRVPWMSLALRQRQTIQCCCWLSSACRGRDQVTLGSMGPPCLPSSLRRRRRHPLPSALAVARTPPPPALPHHRLGRATWQRPGGSRASETSTWRKSPTSAVCGRQLCWPGRSTAVGARSTVRSTLLRWPQPRLPSSVAEQHRVAHGTGRTASRACDWCPRLDHECWEAPRMKPTRRSEGGACALCRGVCQMHCLGSERGRISPSSVGQAGQAGCRGGQRSSLPARAAGAGNLRRRWRVAGWQRRVG